MVKITDEREKTHGNHSVRSCIEMQLKESIHNTNNWKYLSFDKQSSLDMIAVKISRILEGDPRHIDHWEDIAGYAMLVVEKFKQKV